MVDMTKDDGLTFDAECGCGGVREKEDLRDPAGSVHLPSSTRRTRVFGAET